MSDPAPNRDVDGVDAVLGQNDSHVEGESRPRGPLGREVGWPLRNSDFSLKLKKPLAATSENDLEWAGLPDLIVCPPEAEPDGKVPGRGHLFRRERIYPGGNDMRDAALLPHVLGQVGVLKSWHGREPTTPCCDGVDPGR